MPVGIAACLALDAVCGLANGLLVTRFRIPSLIATLAVGTMANGFAFMLTGGVDYVGRLPAPFLFLGRGSILGVPVLIVWTAAAVLVASSSSRRRAWARTWWRPARPRRRPAWRERLQISLPDMNAPVSELSGGERQAVAISRALRWEARLVIMDEPTAALGVKERERVLDLVRALHETGVTVILVSHNMDDVVRVSNRVVILRHGRKVADRPVDGLTVHALSQLIIGGNEPGLRNRRSD